jgi:hypothetical protein
MGHETFMNCHADRIPNISQYGGGEEVKSKKPAESTPAGFLSYKLLTLLHCVDHVEDRQVHRHHHASDHDAEEYDHHRLEE